MARRRRPRHGRCGRLDTEAAAQDDARRSLAAALLDDDPRLTTTTIAVGKGKLVALRR